MMHPDEIEELDYATNAHYDYLREAYGDLGDSDEQCEAEYYWDSESGCDIRDIPTVCEPRFDPHVQECVKAFLWDLSILFQPKDWIPF